MEKLIDILSHRRGHGSAGEEAFIAKYIAPLNPTPMLNDKNEVIAYVVNRKNNGVLWSCHIDTVHKTTDNTIMQEVWLSDDGVAFVDSTCDCLGADDGAGVWLLLEMMACGVEGTYIFHRGEEIGCWGSRQMATLHRDWLAQFTHAFAFDRRGTTSIITHQRGQRGCSEALSVKFAALLGLGHESDPTGVYTDTAEYMGIIPECVNVSIGYTDEHFNMEALDTGYLQQLRDAMVAIDWMNAALPVDRDPSKVEYDDSYGLVLSGSMRGITSRRSRTTPLLDPNSIPSIKELYQASVRDLTDYVTDADPEDVAYMIGDLLDEIASLTYELEGIDKMRASDYDDDDYLKVGLV